MALTNQEKEALTKTGKYTGMNWTDAEKAYRSDLTKPSVSNSTTLKNAIASNSTAKTNGTDSGGNTWYITPEGKQISVRSGADVMLDNNGNFIGTRTQAGKPSYISGYNGTDTLAKLNTNGSIGYGSTNYDIMSEIDKAKNARISSRKSALEGLKNKTLSSLQSEKSTTGQNYYNEKNNESAGAQLRAKKLTELMAAKGYSEGANAQEQISGNVALQGTLGSLGQQEQNAYSDIARRGTDAETAYQEGLVQAQNDEEATAAQARLQELGTQRDYGRQDAATAKDDARYNDNLDYTRTEQAHKDWENSLTTSTFPDVQAEINRIINNNDSTDDWQLEGLRKIRGQKVSDAEEKYQKQGIVTADIADALDLPVGTMTETYRAKTTAIQDKLDYDRAWDKWIKNAPLSAKEYQILGIEPGTKYTPPKNTAPIQKSNSTGGNTPKPPTW